MNKNVSHVSQRIVCPKCHTRNLRKSLSPKNGAEYFCDRDHTYFGISELVNKWNYDAADFYGLDGSTQLSSPLDFFKVEFWTSNKLNKAVEVDFREQENRLMDFLTTPVEKWSPLSLHLGLAYGMNVEEYVPYSPDTFEGEWPSRVAREESYDVVNRMLAGIEELEDGFDTRDLPCPILQTGMC